MLSNSFLMLFRSGEFIWFCIAGMLKKSQQWEIHFERLACGANAASAEIPTSASGTVTYNHNSICKY